jgi:hypothetical protein
MSGDPKARVDRVDPEALFTRARGGDAARVIAELDAHVARAPDDFDAWLTLGMIATEARVVDRARAALARAVALAPASLLARVAYARALDPRRARRELAAAQAISKDHAGIARELALVEEELAVIRRRERALGNPARVFLDRLDGERVVVAPPDVVIRTEGRNAILHATTNEHGRIESLFFAIVDLDALAARAGDPQAIADVGARALIAFLGQALALEADEAAALLERLGDPRAAGAIDEGGARVAFVTRDVPSFGAMLGLLVMRPPPA